MSISILVYAPGRPCIFEFGYVWTDALNVVTTMHVVHPISTSDWNERRGSWLRCAPRLLFTARFSKESEAGKMEIHSLFSWILFGKYRVGQPSIISGNWKPSWIFPRVVNQTG